MRASLLTSVVMVCALAGCSRRATPPLATSTAAPQALPAATSVETKTSAAHGSRKAEGVDVPVFVDGQQRATLRFGELPTTIAPVRNDGDTRKEARYFRLYDYLAAIGVPMTKLRAVHLRGNGRRVASLLGSELAREKDRFVFDFMERDTGIAKTRWDTTGLANTFRVDEIRELFVFVDKDVPALDARRSCYASAPTEPCSDAIHYADDAPAKGTRIYVDGRLVGQVKRRRLGDALVVGTEANGASRFALAKLLRELGVDPARAKGVELLHGDDVIARGDDLARHEGELTFVLPPHRHGRVLLRVPAAWRSSSGEQAAAAHPETEVTAVLVHQTTGFSKRPITNVPDAPPSEDEAPATVSDDG